MILGVIGEYLARIYMESKDRPIFVLKEDNMEQGYSDEKRINVLQGGF